MDALAMAKARLSMDELVSGDRELSYREIDEAEEAFAVNASHYRRLTLKACENGQLERAHVFALLAIAASIEDKDFN